MKTKAINLYIIAAVYLTCILGSIVSVTSCSTTATTGGVDKAKIAAVANVALEYAVSQNKIKTEDAELIREAIAIAGSGKFDKDSLIPAAELALKVAESKGAISPDRAAAIRLAFALLG